MIIKSPQEESPSLDDHAGYDPTQSNLLDDPELAYNPQYVPSEPGDASSSDRSGAESEEEFTFNNAETVQSPPLDSDRESGACTPIYEPVAIAHDHILDPKLDTIDNDDREYRVQPLLDVTTPSYAPSRAFNSADDSDNDEQGEGNDVPTSSSNFRLDRQSSPSERSLSVEHQHDQTQIISSYLRDSNEVVSSDEELASSDGSLPEEQPGQPVETTPKVEKLEPEMSHEIKDSTEDAEDTDVNKFAEDFEGFDHDEQPESQVEGIIADIFGESDAEEEFEGFAENELDKGGDEIVSLDNVATETAESTKPAEESSEEEREQFVSDFDRIMERRREEGRRKRRRNRDIEFLNDSDDIIIELVTRMKAAADEDRQFLAAGQPATKKLSMANEVIALLRRADLKSALLENGMLSAITEWLSPLPGHTLPNLVIRDSLLSCLSEFQSLSAEVLQESGIGKALMYLYKHPRETRENKNKAGRLINEWLRPIFNLTSDYRTLTKEERKQLDYEHLPKRRPLDNETYSHRDINRELDGEGKGLLRPGDPGWIGRARVPQPSNKDYVVRPKWRVSGEGCVVEGDDEDDNDLSQRVSMLRRRRKGGRSSGAGGPGTTSRIETHIRALATNAKIARNKSSRAVSMSIEGRNMSL